MISPADPQTLVIIAGILGLIIVFAIVTRAAMQVDKALKEFDLEKDGE